MILEKEWKKIPNSAGNVFMPQDWYKWGMLSLTLKRFVGTRTLSVMDIPQYVNELDELENIYFGRRFRPPSSRLREEMG